MGPSTIILAVVSTEAQDVLLSDEFSPGGRLCRQNWRENHDSNHSNVFQVHFFIA